MKVDRSRPRITAHVPTTSKSQAARASTVRPQQACGRRLQFERSHMCGWRAHLDGNDQRRDQKLACRMDCGNPRRQPASHMGFGEVWTDGCQARVPQRLWLWSQQSIGYMVPARRCQSYSRMSQSAAATSVTAATPYFIANCNLSQLVNGNF
jgi:hypothetical protein